MKVKDIKAGEHYRLASGAEVLVRALGEIRITPSSRPARVAELQRLDNNPYHSARIVRLAEVASRMTKCASKEQRSGEITER